MKTETLISKLKEKGYVFPTVLQWTANDIDARLKEIGQGDQVKMISQEDKLYLLEDFFNEHEDQICEFINQKLEDFLESANTFNVSQQPF
jgi:hypothetical protein